MSITLYRPYVTVKDVKYKCGLSLSETTNDNNIKDAINKASRYIDGITKRYYYKKSYTSEYLSTSNGFEGWTIKDEMLFTPKLAPVISITTLIENETTLTENTNFYVDKEAGMIEKNGGSWLTTPRKIVITCDLGYDSDDTTTPSADIPGDVELYALEIAARFSGLYKKTVKNYVSGQSESVDLFGVPKEIERALLTLQPVGV